MMCTDQEVKEAMKQLHKDLTLLMTDLNIDFSSIASKIHRSVSTVSLFNFEMFKGSIRIRMKTLLPYIYAIASHPDNKDQHDSIDGLNLRKFLDSRDEYLYLRMLPKEYKGGTLVEAQQEARTLRQMINYRETRISKQDLYDAIAINCVRKGNASEYETRWRKDQLAIDYASLYRYAKLTDTAIVKFKVEDILAELEKRKK